MTTEPTTSNPDSKPPPSEPAKTGNRFNRHKRKILCLYIVGLLVVMEIAARILVSAGVFRYQWYAVNLMPFLDYRDKHFGVWHYPDTTIEQRGLHFAVTYTTNSYGARDRPRTKRSAKTPRYIVLGDSFVEGWGSEGPNRFTNLLENELGAEFLNFGTSGKFGSIQESLLYEHLASQFDHTDVLIFFLPANDFRDNDASHHEPEFYRPYYRKTDNGYEVYYTVDWDNRIRTPSRTATGRFKRHLYNNIYLLNLLRQMKSSNFKAQEVKGPEQSTYDDFTEEDGRILLESYRRIVQHAGQRRVRIFIIPTNVDLRTSLAKTNDLKCVKLLEDFTQQYDNVTSHDLLPGMIRYLEKHKDVSYSDFFIPADGHWSVLGHRVTADLVAKTLKDTDRLPVTPPN